MKLLFVSSGAILLSALSLFSGSRTNNAPAITQNIPLAKVSTAKTSENLSSQEVVNLANAFKATLSATQITTLQLDYTLANAKKWSNLPVTMSPRIGIRLGDLSATQLAAAKALIQAAAGTTNNEGYAEVQQLWAADDYLSANGGGTTYGAGQYYMAFLGTPSMTGTWELQFGGHHLAFANTYANGNLSGATPAFRACEPFGAFTSGGNSYQPMGQEQVALAAMLAGLDATQTTTARLSTTFTDILLGPNKDWQFPTVKSGLRCNTLTAAQKALVMNAIRTYVNDIDDTNAAMLMALYESQINDTYIAFSGNAALSVQNDYVRIDGPRVWLEYSVQRGIVLSAPHPHSVWRDRQTDYGGLGNPSVSAKELDNNALKIKLFPNPVVNRASLQFELPESGLVKINIFDISGRLVATPYQNQLSAGKNTISFEVNQLHNGTYLYVLENNGVSKASASFIKQ